MSQTPHTVTHKEYADAVTGVHPPAPIDSMECDEDDDQVNSRFLQVDSSHPHHGHHPSSIIQPTPSSSSTLTHTNTSQVSATHAPILPALVPMPITPTRSSPSSPMIDSCPHLDSLESISSIHQNQNHASETPHNTTMHTQQHAQPQVTHEVHAAHVPASSHTSAAATAIVVAEQRENEESSDSSHHSPQDVGVLQQKPISKFGKYQRRRACHLIYQAWCELWHIPFTNDYIPYLHQFTLPLREATLVYNGAIQLSYLMNLGDAIQNDAGMDSDIFRDDDEEEFYTRELPEFGDDEELNSSEPFQVAEPDALRYIGMKFARRSNLPEYYYQGSHNPVGIAIGKLLAKTIRSCPHGNHPAYECEFEHGDYFQANNSHNQAQPSAAPINHPPRRQKTPILFNPNTIDPDELYDLPFSMYVRIQKFIFHRLKVKVNLTWLCAIVFLRILNWQINYFYSGVNKLNHSYQHHRNALESAVRWIGKFNTIPNIDFTPYLEPHQSNQEFLAAVQGPDVHVAHSSSSSASASASSSTSNSTVAASPNKNQTQTTQS